MKRLSIISALLLFFTFTSFAQDMALNTSGEQQQLGTPPSVTEKSAPMHALPAYPGGSTDLAKYLEEHIQYPALAKKKRVEGLTKVAFNVSPEGIISNVHITERTHSICDKGVLKAIKAMPRWVPRYRNGKPVASEVELVVRYKLTF